MKKVSEILTVQIKSQITRLSESNTDSLIKRKRPFDDISNTEIPVVEASGVEARGMDDTFVLKEIDLLLGYTLIRKWRISEPQLLTVLCIVKQWYLGILQKR